MLARSTVGNEDVRALGSASISEYGRDCPDTRSIRRPGVGAGGCPTPTRRLAYGATIAVSRHNSPRRSGGHPMTRPDGSIMPPHMREVQPVESYGY